MSRRIQYWLAAIAATTFLILVVGGITRLTHSGLSIVDWRPLIGIVPPLSQGEWIESFERYQQYPEYRQLRPQMTLAEYKAIFFWEYLHRLLARAIGLVFLVPFALFFFSGALSRPLTGRILALFALGSLQGVAGWLMVRSGLVDRPSVSHYRLAIHLALALVILGYSVWLIRELGASPQRSVVTPRARKRATAAVMAAGLLLSLQIVWGAFVAGLKAGFGFNTFPLMDGTLLPIRFWTLSPAALNLVQNPWGVQWMHRLLGTLLLLWALALPILLRRVGMDRTTRRLSAVLLWAVAAQYVLGVLTLVYVVPISLALPHQAMAAVIVAVWVCLAHHVRRRVTTAA